VTAPRLILKNLQVLIDSMGDRGQKAAIEVADLGDGRYGLIFGFRCLAALRTMALTPPDTNTILAIICHPSDGAAADQAMVEENEICVGLSFYERGRIVARAVIEGCSVQIGSPCKSCSPQFPAPGPKSAALSPWCALLMMCCTFQLQ
jgi:hypothetical protein